MVGQWSKAVRICEKGEVEKGMGERLGGRRDGESADQVGGRTKQVFAEPPT